MTGAKMTAAILAAACSFPPAILAVTNDISLIFSKIKEMATIYTIHLLQNKKTIICPQLDFP
jgi:hypothetical protein